MTPGEIKFAVGVESALNKIPQPEYRQLCVETIWVLTLLAEVDFDGAGRLVSIDDIIKMADEAFRQEIGRAHV